MPDRFRPERRNDDTVDGPRTPSAFELGVSGKTITTYRTRLLRKLELQDEHDLVVFAVRNGLVQW